MPLWLLLIVSSIVAVLAASVIFGVVDIGYKITPTGPEAPTMTPNQLNLDMGSIPSGSSGIKEFPNVATLTLQVDYEITVTLDLATTGDFTTLDVRVRLYKPGEEFWTYSFLVWNSPYGNEISQIVETGTYDVTVKVDYTAVSVTSETTGTVKIDVSFPG